jgi:putative ABC transport system ATP-binding protein
MAKPVVELRGVEKDYGSGDALLTVLHGIDLTVHQGEMVGIIGASGSGKTTLMNILGCLDYPTRGQYRMNGEDISDISDERLSRVRNAEIGFIFQTFNLIAQLTVLENVELPLFYRHVPRSKRKQGCLELLETVGLSHRLTHYPSQLSGGERQRVAVARSLVNQPSLLLADEPTGNLDSKNGEEILKLFHELHAMGRTIIVVTHNPEIADQLPRVIELKDGIVLDDTRIRTPVLRGGGA